MESYLMVIGENRARIPVLSTEYFKQSYQSPISDSHSELIWLNTIDNKADSDQHSLYKYKKINLTEIEKCLQMLFWQ